MHLKPDNVVFEKNLDFLSSSLGSSHITVSILCVELRVIYITVVCINHYHLNLSLTRTGWDFLFAPSLKRLKGTMKKCP